jgi:tetratricopeptide (TPR) repeat protein/tRNA A-37 threonylcarbamoyl transferase component Bud32
MGCVFKARQVKAERIVALKVPHAGAGQDLLVRFRTEARAVARVQHPHIVQVFEVGDVGGVPFMALEFCPGGSLSVALDGTPLAPRDAAELAETIARAVAAAHAAGVVHRDLKPANVLLGSAATTDRLPAWSPKVSDFGLARQLDLDDAQTRTGVVIGTPSYMAPEQARGDTRSAGPLADVYSLGAILYELLTGRPPFKGTTVLETIEQVTKQDPVSPSRIRQHIPRDLETVTLKCLRKEPEKRYASASALADDLRRFLGGEPIQARPVGRLERLAKRAARNPVPSALVVLLITVIAIGIGFGVWKQIHLIAERDRARTHFQMSMRAIEELLTEVAEADLAAEPMAEKTREALLEKALRFYRDLLAVEAGDPTVSWEAARAARRVGDIYRLLGRYPEAVAAYDEAADRIGRLTYENRNVFDIRRELALVYNWRGEVFRLLERLDEADAEYQRAADIQSWLGAYASGQTDVELELAQSLDNRGIVAGVRGRYAEAEDRFREAAAVLAKTDSAPPRHRQFVARIAINASDVLRKAGRATDAVTAAESATHLLDSLLAEQPTRPDYLHERGAAGNNLAIARLAAKDRDGAFTAATEARKRLTELVADFPRSVQFRVDLARTCTTLSQLEYKSDRPAAEKYTRESVLQLETLLAVRPNVPSYHGDLGLALDNLGRLTVDRPGEARGHFTRGIDEVLVALRANGDDADLRQVLRKLTNDLAENLAATGDCAEIARRAECIKNGLFGRPEGVRRAVAFLARAATAVGKQPDADRRINAFAGQAVEMMRGCDPDVLKGILDDPDCQPFRPHPVFREAFGR